MIQSFFLYLKSRKRMTSLRVEVPWGKSCLGPKVKSGKSVFGVVGVVVFIQYVNEGIESVADPGS